MMIFTLLKKPVLYIPFVMVLFTAVWFWGAGDAEESGLFAVKEGEFVQEVSVSGRVIARESVDLVFSQTGRVAAVYAAVGDRVAVGAVLAAVENEEARAEIVQKEAALAAAKAGFAALMEGASSAERAVAEQAVLSAAVAEAQAREALLDALQSAYTNADDAIRHRVDQFMESPRSAHPKLALPSGDQQIVSDSEWMRFLIEADLTEWSATLASLATEADTVALVEKAEDTLSRIRTFLEKISALVNALTASPSLSQTTINGYRADVALARANINGAGAAQTSAVTAGKNAAAARVTAEKQLALLNAAAREEDVAAEEAQVIIAEADLARARERYQKTLIRAPFAGVITRMEAKVGGAASSQEALISMISNDTLQIESFIPEINVPLVAVGNPAAVILDAYGAGATFLASVIAIDPAETVRDGVSMYRAIFSFVGKDARIKPGMTANITIETERKAGIIAVPQGAIIEQSGKKHVRVRDAAGDSALREVTVGDTSSLGTVEITAGLREGETVILAGEK